MSFLIHFNRNHSIKTGRFMPGDGDGDGIVNDHKNQKSSDEKKSSTSGGGAITLDDEEEDDEEKQAAEDRKTRAANLKELERRAKLKDKNKKKKSSKKGSTNKKKKKKSKAEKAKVITDVFKTEVDEIQLKGSIPSQYSDMDINTLLKKTDGETVSLIQRILAANNQ